jgi:DNA-binding SARP family transcriptional activator
MAAAMETADRPYLSLLASPGLRCAGQSTPFSPERRYQLLAMLGFHSGRWLERQQLARRLWPDHVDAEARRNLRKVILQAREVRGTAGLEVTDQALRWTVDCDVQAFEKAVLDRRHGDVVDLLIGQPLAGLEAVGDGASAEWLRDERVRLLSAWQQSAVEVLRTQLEGRSRIALAQRLLDVDSLDESAVAIVIDDALARGSLTTAHRLFRAYAERLADELGIEPSAQIRERLHSAAAITTATTPLEVDVSAPVAGTAFIGRSRALAEIDRLLGHDGLRLLTLVGPGGVGKSRLAREVLSRCARHFSGGAWWVDLQDLDNLDALVHRLAQRLDVSVSDASDPMDPLCRALQLRGGGKLMLVLDKWRRSRAISPGFSRRSHPAANSMASGRPPTASMMSSTACRWTESSKPRCARRARSSNSPTASKAAAASMSRLSSSGLSSPASGMQCSAALSGWCREVTTRVAEVAARSQSAHPFSDGTARNR